MRAALRARGRGGALSISCRSSDLSELDVGGDGGCEGDPPREAGEELLAQHARDAARAGGGADNGAQRGSQHARVDDDGLERRGRGVLNARHPREGLLRGAGRNHGVRDAACPISTG